MAEHERLGKLGARVVRRQIGTRLEELAVELEELAEAQRGHRRRAGLIEGDLLQLVVVAAQLVHVLGEGHHAAPQRLLQLARRQLRPRVERRGHRLSGRGDLAVRVFGVGERGGLFEELIALAVQRVIVRARGTPAAQSLGHGDSRDRNRLDDSSGCGLGRGFRLRRRGDGRGLRLGLLGGRGGSGSRLQRPFQPQRGAVAVARVAQASGGGGHVLARLL